MTLSEAMRKGAAMKPQGFGGNQGDERSCAVGAVMDASTNNDLEIGYPELRAPYPTSCPKCECCFKWLASAIVHLNDYHFEPRERIADWLEEQGL
jgi:hypothetical protein